MAGGRIAASELNIATALAAGDRVMIVRANGKTETIDASLLSNGEGGTPIPGPEGKSAYQVWLEAGNKGTEQEFLKSLEGTEGSPGKNALNPNFSVNVTTLEAGSNATATITGTYPNLTINLGIPRGADGEGGPVVPPVSEKMYYGRLSISEVGGSVIPYSNITESMIKSSRGLIESEPKTLGKTSLGLASETAMGDYCIVLVPKSKGYTATVDDGFGSKVQFNTEDAGANGIDLDIDGITYKLYGHILLSQSEVFIYVD